MYHGAVGGCEGREGGVFGLEVGAGALVAPFDGDEGLREGFEGRRRRAQREPRFRVCGFDFGARRRMGGRDARSGHKGAVAFDGAVEVLGEGVVDDADEGFQLVGEGEGDGDVRVGVHEVGGAVDGVDDERGCQGETRGGSGGGGFFAEEGVGGVGVFEGGGDHGFDGFVGFGDEVGGFDVSAHSADLERKRICLQFFLVSTVDGFAEVIMSPAFLASSMRKSWICWRFGCAMVADVQGNPGCAEKSINWFEGKRYRESMSVICSTVFGLLDTPLRRMPHDLILSPSPNPNPEHRAIGS